MPAMKKIRSFLLIITIILAVSVNVSKSSAQAGTAYDLIAAVNALRAANGLPPYKINNILMSTAQQHSDYQASIRTVTHTGADGSRPIARVMAAGFGGGKKVFVSENIAGGLKMSVETAIYTYWQDSLHMHTMLHPNAQYVGAGVAKAGDYVYYTLDVGYIPGGAPLSTSHPAGTSPAGGTPQAYPTPVPYDPFIKSTPRADGAIIHVVGYGQTLIGIANTYKVPLKTILDLNGFTLKTMIYPGNKIIIRSGTTATPTSEATSTPTSTPAASATSRPTRRPSPTASKTIAPAKRPSPTPTPAPPGVIAKLASDPKALVLAVIVLSGLILVATWVEIREEKRNDGN